MKPNYHFEEEYWQEGKVVVGVDEVGVGPLAGPVVAGAVILPTRLRIGKLQDSKKMTEKARQECEVMIKKLALAWGIGSASVEEIEEVGIRKATFLAMKRALAELTIPYDVILVDGYRIEGVEKPCVAIIKGDSKSRSIAAASIIAKVHRDTYMEGLQDEFPAYNFKRHKGYGTREHVEAIKKWGKTKHHRTSFIHV